MIEVREVHMKKEGEEIACWDDEERWEIKTRGFELHGDILLDAKAEIIIIKPGITGAKLGVEISNDGYLSITMLA